MNAPVDEVKARRTFLDLVIECGAQAALTMDTVVIVDEAVLERFAGRVVALAVAKELLSC